MPALFEFSIEELSNVRLRIVGTALSNEVNTRMVGQVVENSEAEKGKAASTL